MAGDRADYVGGHFNLYLSAASLQTTLGSDFTNFQDIFGGSFDGTRQDAVFGNAAQSNYTLHSKEINSSTAFQFHFDKYNPGSIVGLVQHFFAEVLGGHKGTPCLDPAGGLLDDEAAAHSDSWSSGLRRHLPMERSRRTLRKDWEFDLKGAVREGPLRKSFPCSLCVFLRTGGTLQR